MTPSNMLPLGTLAPVFDLWDVVSHANQTYAKLKGSKGTVIVFMCNHCPFVVHVIEELVRISNDYRVQGVRFIAINSNDIVKYPQDNPQKMLAFADKYKMEFPYLFDENQEVAKAYDAACTPDFYLFNSEDKLAYRGQLDESRPNNGIVVSGSDLRNAIDSLLYSRVMNPIQKPSIGCNIKWR